jgi:hypothetical protein
MEPKQERLCQNQWRYDYETGFVWHRWQLIWGKATLSWQTPQYFPSNISTIE